jgi:hypothetical protein
MIRLWLTKAAAARDGQTRTARGRSHAEGTVASATVDEDTKARQWRHDHVTQALTALAALTDAYRVDASQDPAQVADAVAAHVQ